MTGLILCGGQSQRMGHDKGLIKFGDNTWAQIAAGKLRSLHLPVKISVNEQQLSSYGEIFSKDDLITDDTTLSINGPLQGLFSCHTAYPTEDLFVLACDMLLMETPLLSSLLTKYNQEKFDAYIFSHGGQAEPLCGIYTGNALSQVLNVHKKEALQKHSMKFLLEKLNVCCSLLAAEEKKYFQNFNCPGDIPAIG